MLRTVLMALPMSAPMPFQMLNAICLMPFHAPDQSPWMRLVTVLMMPCTTPMAVCTVIWMPFHTPPIYALMAPHMAFHTAWMVPMFD